MKKVFFLAFIFLLSGCQRKGHYVNDEIVLGYRGKARLNPYLAAERYFSGHLPVAVKSSRSLTDLDETVAVATMPASFLTTELMGQRVLDWVSRGGRLILLLEGGESTYDDFSSRPLGESGDDKILGGMELPGLDLILRSAGFGLGKRDFVEVKDGKNDPGKRNWHEHHLEMPGRDFTVEMEGDLALKSTRGGEKAWPFAWAANGAGEIYFLASARPLRSAYLDRADHLNFLAGMIGENPPGGVLFLYGEGFSFWSLLWRHGWRLVLAVLVMLIFWLWLRLPRFGPRLEDPSDDERQYDELLLASGRFLWKRKAVLSLIEPLREEIQQRFHLHHELLGEAEREPLFEHLAERGGLGLEEVIEIMSRKDFQDGASLTRVVRGLKKLHNTR